MRVVLLLSFLSLSSCNFPKALSSYYAKEVCSCLFVVKQSEKYCHNFGQELIPNWLTRVDYEVKKVKASGLFFTTEARFLSRREGCQIIK